jgi:hypothetical protein
MKPERQFRHAATALIGSKYQLLLWWVDGDEKAYRDEQGRWYHFGWIDDPEVIDHCERVYRLAEWLELNAPLASTGFPELDTMIARWLSSHRDRFVRREQDRFIAIDRGVELRASTATSYEDSVRKVLQIALDRDFFAEKHGAKP